MKKFITIIVAFMSVLTLWGQVGNDSINRNDLNDYLNKFQNWKTDVIQQALQKDLIQDKDTVLITSVINDAVYLCNNYEGIATINDTLSSNIKKELTDFCIKYFKDITAKRTVKKNKKEFYIYIESVNFFKTIQSYQRIFQPLREKVENILTPKANEFEQEDLEESTEESDQASETQDSIPLYILIILGLVIATSIILAALTLKKINRTDKELRELKAKINKIEEAAASSKSQKNKTQNQTTSTPGATKKKSEYPPQPPVQNNNVAVTPPPVPEKKENISKTPQETYLYANTNANGGVEFYKATPENTGDKVFMIILRKADDENGEFTIAAMSADFMKEVITNRDMFLPPAFCERIIGSQNPSRIEVDTKGKAKKVGGKWQMQERMKIRLI